MEKGLWFSPVEPFQLSDSFSSTNVIRSRPADDNVSVPTRSTARFQSMKKHDKRASRREMFIDMSFFATSGSIVINAVLRNASDDDTSAKSTTCEILSTSSLRICEGCCRLGNKEYWRLYIGFDFHKAGEVVALYKLTATFYGDFLSYNERDQILFCSEI